MSDKDSDEDVQINDEQAIKIVRDRTIRKMLRNASGPIHFTKKGELYANRDSQAPYPRANSVDPSAVGLVGHPMTLGTHIEVQNLWTAGELQCRHHAHAMKVWIVKTEFLAL
ncbi:hypothetical protein LTR15_002584 [Elasticomyces elasticus]|nr:hypothetical protein LTR15_002584 [Elasticomyces elasticus]